VSERMKGAGRPDLDAQARTLIEGQWRQLVKTKATAVYLPGERKDEVVTPMSIATRQLVARPGKEFSATLRGFARIDLERIEVPWGEAFRWTSMESGQGELSEVRSRMLGYGFPLPTLDDVPSDRGIVFLTSIAHLEETGPEMVDALAALSDSIMDTFRWRE